MNTNLIRPQYLKDFIGQDDSITNLSVYIESSKKRNEILDHCLFYGPPGLGKTTLARIIANEVGGNIKEISGTVIQNPGDLASILSRLSPNDVLFIDEIHRIDKSSEELLYSAMEDYCINILIGSDNQSRNISVDIPPFILIGATTKIGLLSRPFRDRFGIQINFKEYDINSIGKIILRACKIFNILIDDNSCKIIAKVSRGIPRIAIQIIRRIRDFLDFDEINYLDEDKAKIYLNKLKIDHYGLNENDREYLKIIYYKFGGGPVGINLLSDILNDESNNIEQTIESYLIKQGYIERTQKGRIITKKGISVISNTI